MEDIWKRIIQNQETIRYKQSDFFSPYCESVVGSIKKIDDVNDQITMNTFYRYDDIFLSLFEQTQIDDYTRDWLLDCMMHLLTRLELWSGASSHEYEIRKKWNEVENGYYGSNAQNLFAMLDRDAKYIASHYIVRQEKNGESVSLFGKVLLEIIKDGVLYKSEIRPKELLLYIGAKESDDIKAQIEFVKEVYMPFDYSLRVFWDHSFGIIDNDKCMRINNIEIY